MMKPIRMGVAVLSGCVFTLALVLGSAQGAVDHRLAPHAPSAGTARYVSPAGSDSGACTSSGAPCRTPQYAVEQAAPGDEVLLATGTYTGVHVRPATPDYPGPGLITQVLHITQTVTVRGGYSADFATQDPNTYPTTLDAQGQGRVLFIGGDVSPTVESLRLINGDATGVGGHPLFDRDAGGGVYVITATAALNSLAVLTNVVPASFGNGGGVFLYRSVSNLSGGLIQGNSAGGSGGGVDVHQSDGANLSNNTILNNDANAGGGLHAYQSALTLSGNVVRGNSASSSGAGVSFENSDYPDHQPTLTGNVIQSNTSAFSFSFGGGLYLFFSDPIMSGNRIQDNVAGRGGGAYLYLSDPASTNDVIRDNQASQLAPGLYLNGSRVILQHTTLAANTGADGSGLLMEANSDFGSTIHSTAAVTNAVIASHTLGITASVANTATLNGVLWFSNGGNSAGAGLVQATNALTGNPNFGVDGYHVISPSIAIDNGVDSGVAIDIDGFNRPQGSNYDLGADEYGSFDVYLPVILR